ncbi:DUF5681 domain-containing protein [Methylobacterium sp. J-070]|uniref:DUF5681 domain-containing protein n=1 Tax=Methylobacterium sp. J-070 TaxID=2836650 RepID=UPI001FBB6125|nr:DUF5681 domain-containing protein [Methylobacterium sp. J-070]MCJ2054773.1 DUF5681 domain-containing protein [Methylobacterium sp. J-070]
MAKPSNLKPFQPGQSGNPNGRPRIPDDVKALARSYTREAIETAAEIMRNPEETGTARMSAINTILDRGWGKAPQHVTVDNMGELSDAELGSELAAAVEQLRRLGRAGAGEAPDDGGEAPPTAH